MGVRGAVMRVFRSIFREQKTRLQVDWLTHTDELIMFELEDGDSREPTEIATEIDRSVEYVADRCRQLALRGLLDEMRTGTEGWPAYLLSELGKRYVAGEMTASELESLEESEE